MDEHAPVAANEFVYRRIHRTAIQPVLPLSVHFAGFRPNQRDAAGLSVFRALFVPPAGTLANVETSRRNDYYVVRLSVPDLQQLGLTVVADPDPNGPPGHALIPELNWLAYQADRPRWRGILIEQAKLASTAIVHEPS